MNRTRVAAVAVLFSVSALLGCSSGKGTSQPSQPTAPADEAVLASFVEAEKKLDERQLTAALAAGPDLEKAAGDIRAEWDAARKRILSTLGPEGVVRPAAKPARFVPAAFDFASMAWSTWSLGLLYLGYDASGTVEHGPTPKGDVTTTESTTVTAAKKGPVASVKLSTTRTQTSKLGWSVSQTGTVELELPLCPDTSGVIAFDMRIELKTTASSGNGATATVTDTITGHTVATVNDDARLASVVVTGDFNHTSSAQGQQSGISVGVRDGNVTANSTGNATDAQVQEARSYGAFLLQFAGSLAAARSGDFYEHGYCTEIQAAPDNKPTKVAVGATQPFDVRVRHKWDNTELTDRITATLDGAASVSPTGRTPTPTKVNYVAPKDKNKRAIIKLESRSKRGKSSRDVAVRTPGGYAIHDVWTLKGNNGKQNMDAVNCDSPHGPWHVVISGDLAAMGWTKLDAYYDITIDPATGNGTVRGEEHSVTVENHTYDGSSTGTAVMTPDGDNYLIKMEIDYDVTWRTPTGIEKYAPGRDRIRGHVSRELHVIPATDKECP
jgi:hypothetical protein